MEARIAAGDRGVRFSVATVAGGDSGDGVGRGNPVEMGGRGAAHVGVGEELAVCD